MNDKSEKMETLNMPKMPEIKGFPMISENVSPYETLKSLPTKVLICSGVIVDAVVFEYADGSSIRFGGTGGGTKELMMEPGEYIISISGENGSYEGLPVVSRLELATNKGRKLESHPGTAHKNDFSSIGIVLGRFSGRESRNKTGNRVYLAALKAENIAQLPGKDFPGIKK